MKLNGLGFATLSKTVVKLSPIDNSTGLSTSTGKKLPSYITSLSNDKLTELLQFTGFQDKFNFPTISTTTLTQLRNSKLIPTAYDLLNTGYADLYNVMVSGVIGNPGSVPFKYVEKYITPERLAVQGITAYNLNKPGSFQPMKVTPVPLGGTVIPSNFKQAGTAGGQPDYLIGFQLSDGTGIRFDMPVSVAAVMGMTDDEILKLTDKDIAIIVGNTVNPGRWGRNAVSDLHERFYKLRPGAINAANNAIIQSMQSSSSFVQVRNLVESAAVLPLAVSLAPTALITGNSQLTQDALKATGIAKSVDVEGVAHVGGDIAIVAAVVGATILAANAATSAAVAGEGSGTALSTSGFVPGSAPYVGGDVLTASEAAALGVSAPASTSSATLVSSLLTGATNAAEAAVTTKVTSEIKDALTPAKSTPVPVAAAQSDGSPLKQYLPFIMAGIGLLTLLK